MPRVARPTASLTLVGRVGAVWRVGRGAYRTGVLPLLSVDSA